MTNNQRIAECLLSERCNASEIAEALEITRQSALSIIRTIDRKRLRRLLSAGRIASTWMGLDLPTLPPLTGFGE